MGLGLLASSPSLVRSLLMMLRTGPEPPVLSRTPDPSQQLAVGQHPARVNRKLHQHPVLDAGKRHRTPSDGHLALAVVDGQVSRHVGLGRFEVDPKIRTGG